MAIIVLVIDDSALARVQEAAAVQNEKFDVVLSEQFAEFLFKQNFTDTPPPAKVVAGNGAAQPVDSRDAIVAKLIAAGAQVNDVFVFNDLVPLVPEVAELTKQEQTSYASLFARRFNEGGLIEKLPKVGKNATQYKPVGGQFMPETRAT